MSFLKIGFRGQTRPLENERPALDFAHGNSLFILGTIGTLAARFRMRNIRIDERDESARQASGTKGTVCFEPTNIDLKIA